MAQIFHIARPPKKSRFFTPAKSRDRWPQETHVTTGTPSLGLRSSVVERNYLDNEKYYYLDNEILLVTHPKPRWRDYT